MKHFIGLESISIDLDVAEGCKTRDDSCERMIEEAWTRREVSDRAVRAELSVSCAGKVDGRCGALFEGKLFDATGDVVCELPMATPASPDVDG